MTTPATLAAGTRVMVDGGAWAALGVIESYGIAVAGVSDTTYLVRLDDGPTVWCLPCALWDLSVVALRPRANLALVVGRA